MSRPDLTDAQVKLLTKAARSGGVRVKNNRAAPAWISEALRELKLVTVRVLVGGDKLLVKATAAGEAWIMPTPDLSMKCARAFCHMFEEEPDGSWVETHGTSTRVVVRSIAEAMDRGQILVGHTDDLVALTDLCGRVDARFGSGRVLSAIADLKGASDV